MIRSLRNQIKSNKLTLLIGLLLAVVVLAHPAKTSASIACPTDLSRGTVTGTFTIPFQATTQYRVYVRMMASSSANDTVALKIGNSTTCYNMGGKNAAGATLPVYSGTADWTNDSADWVDSELGSTTPVDVSLAGNNTSISYELIGNADAVRVDRVIFTQENGNGTCLPTGTGDNCGTILNQINQTGNLAPALGSFTSSAGSAAGNAIGNINDQDETTRWIASTQTNNSNISVDLCKNQTNQATCSYTLSGVSVIWAGDTTKDYLIQTSPDNSTWTTAASGATNGQSPDYINTTFSTQPTGRYLRIVSVDFQTGAPTGASIWELGIYGTKTTTQTCSPSASPTATAPATVTQNNTSTTYTAIAFSWTAGQPSANCTITGYNIYRDGSLTPLNGNTPVATTSYTDSGMNAGDSHTYQVQTVDSGPNLSAKTAAVSFSSKPDNLGPNTPTGLTATLAAGAATINLSWNAVTIDNPNPGGSGVAGYNLYRDTGSSTAFTSPPINGSTPISTTNFSNTGLAASTKYNYEVKAVDNAGNEGSPSTVATATTAAPACGTNKPSAPSGFTAGAKTLNSVSFSWSTASVPATGCTLSGYNVYQVFPGTSNTPVLISGAVSGTSQTANVSGLSPGVNYSFVVVGFDTSGNASGTVTSSTTPSITISTAADSTAPSAPANVTDAAISSGEVDLHWTASTDNVGVTSYKIYQTLSGATTTTTISSSVACSGSNCSYNDTSVTASNNYTYQVSALDAAANESAKTTASPNPVTTPASVDTTPPAAPASLGTPVVAAQTVQLSWPASTSNDVAHYNVYLKVNGVDILVGTSTSTSFTYQPSTTTCLEPGVTYIFDVKAVDTSGNVSTTAATTTTKTMTTGAFQGDINCNLRVDFGDLTILAKNWRLAGNYLPWQGDVNGDGAVSFIDLQSLATNWGKSW